MVIYTLLFEKKTKKGTKNLQRINMWLFATLILGIVGVAVFLLTEDMSLLMSIVDKWTIVSIVIFAAELLCITLMFKHKK